MRQKEKYKAAKARIAEQQKEIEKLRKEIESTKDLQLRHFKKEDGSQDLESYINFRDRQRDMESKIESMTRASEEQQRAMDLEIDSELTKRCFSDPTEREEYERMKDVTGPVLFQFLEEKDIQWQCNCSYEKISGLLKSIGVDELTDMIEKDGETEVVCHVCSSHYHFDREQLEAVLAEMKQDLLNQ